MIRVLVCGGRSFNDRSLLYRQMDTVVTARGPIEVIIQGGARGADQLAYEWAAYRGIPTQQFDADWDRHGKSAGMLRNQRMLSEGRPDLVVAFPGKAGTDDMVRRAKAAGVPVIQVEP